MRLMVRTLMFLACLIYGAMPATAAMDMSMPASENPSSGMAKSHPVDHDMADASEDMRGQSAPCPHEKSMTHAPFCAACLILIPDIAFAEKGQPPHAAPVPGLQASLVGDAPTPPLPPPRV
ncbi:hypothetical protein [uncultured Agrobacterium sp.]|uniref:hypothetical protein n=1 Tax=uncultured Agrobacterium sp. TaxID=157277 RepID=UPI0025CBB2A8|nr:hypothetical protein [uncultured Agrobacterium sp.]